MMTPVWLVLTSRRDVYEDDVAPGVVKPQAGDRSDQAGTKRLLVGRGRVASMDERVGLRRRIGPTANARRMCAEGTLERPRRRVGTARPCILEVAPWVHGAASC